MVYKLIVCQPTCACILYIQYHLNTKPSAFQTLFVCFSNGLIMWLVGPFKYWIFRTQNRHFCLVFTPPFKNGTIRQPDMFWPFKYQICPRYADVYYNGTNKTFCIHSWWNKNVTPLIFEGRGRYSFAAYFAPPMQFLPSLFWLSYTFCLLASPSLRGLQ